VNGYADETSHISVLSSDSGAKNKHGFLEEKVGGFKFGDVLYWSVVIHRGVLYWSVVIYRGVLTP
jgi:hypothetical protein